MRRLLTAVVLTVLTLLAPLHVASAAAEQGPAPSSSPVQLLAQTPWLQGPGLYGFRVGFSGATPTDRVQVTVYYQVHTRTDFDHDAKGQVDSYHFYQQVVPLSALSGDPQGGVDIQLPIDRAAPAHDPLATVQIGETGVFPVQVALYDSAGRPQGQPLTTFIVYAQNAASAGMLKPLSVGLIVPVSSAPVVAPNGNMGAPSSDQANRLLQLAQVLNADSSVPASILASPLTLDELAGSSTDRTVLTQLNGATVGGPFEVLPAAYAPVSLGDLQNAVPGEVDPQLKTGASTLASAFGLTPDDRTWVVDGPLDGATLSVLIAHRAQQVIVPDGDLTPVPGEVQITFAGATYLDYAGSQLRVISADNTLTSRFENGQTPVLGANNLLAELAMIYTEAPNPISPRGLAVLPPPAWSASADFVQTLLNGLQGNPLLTAVTASQLFASLGQPQATRYISSSQTGTPGVDQGAAITAARGRIDEIQQILGSSPQLEQLQKQLLMAESSSISDSERRAALGAIGRATDEVQHIASLPPATTITLTSTKGQIPLTVLAAGSSHPRIQLHLRSQRLIFRPFSPREGHCTVVSETDELCVLSLTNQNTTLHVPVETRSSGVFPLDVSLEVPGSAGRAALAHDRDTVRSTAVSGVAVIVIAVALTGLVLWWGRDLRRGRRPKGMVPSPVDVTAGDPELDGFFEQRPPDYSDVKDGILGPGAAMSPSGAPSGPNPKIDRDGPARETRKL